MPILRIAQVMEATTGGTRRHLVDLVTHLDQSRFEVSVIYSNLRDPDFNHDIAQFRASGVQVHIVPMVREISPRADWNSYRELKRHFRQNEYDIVHIHSSKAGALARWAIRGLRRMQRPRVVYTPHVFPFLMRVSMRKQQLYLQAERLCAAVTDHWIAVSSTDYNAALQNCICGPDRITRIPNGIVPERFEAAVPREAARESLHLPLNGCILGCVGRLTKQKGQATLVRAMPSLIARIPDAHVVLIGEGEDHPQLTALSRQLRVEDHVHFAGYREGVENLYPAFDILVMPSLWEGCPYSLLEAMYSRLPIVATDIEGNREIVIEGVTGLLVPPLNHNALVEAVTTMYREPETRYRMGIEGRQRVEAEYTVEGMVRRTEDLYLRVAPAREEKG